VNDFLIIDDNAFDIGHLRAVLHMVRGYGIEVRSASSAKDALKAVYERAPDVIFADHLSASETAFSTMERLRGAGYSGPIVVVTGVGDRIKHRQMKAAGAFDVVVKDDLDAAMLAQTLARIRESG
jgi:CheY-like chemotaxis protein